MAGEGSGVLVRYRERHFLVTAAHVADKVASLWILLPHAPLDVAKAVGGHVVKTPVPASGQREDDSLDIAVMEIQAAAVAELTTTYQFVEETLLGVEYPAFAEARYLLAGYPATQTKTLGTTVKSVFRAFQATINQEFPFAITKFRHDHNLAVIFSGEQFPLTGGSAALAPKMPGMSGGGLWFFNNYLEENVAAQTKLVGIIIEQYPKPPHNPEAILATKLTVVLRIIEQAFFT